MNNILISGLTGSGKTSLSQYLSKELDYGYISGSGIRREFHKLPSGGRDLWLRDEKLVSIDNQRVVNTKLEDFIDDELERLNLTKHNHIFDVWFLPWYTKVPSLKILIASSIDIRISRLINSHSAYLDMYDMVQQKDIRSQQYALKKFNIDIIEDKSPFDIIIANDNNLINVFFETSYEKILKELNNKK